MICLVRRLLAVRHEHVKEELRVYSLHDLVGILMGSAKVDDWMDEMDG